MIRRRARDFYRVYDADLLDEDGNLRPAAAERQQDSARPATARVEIPLISHTAAIATSRGRRVGAIVLLSMAGAALALALVRSQSGGRGVAVHRRLPSLAPRGGDGPASTTRGLAAPATRQAHLPAKLTFSARSGRHRRGRHHRIASRPRLRLRRHPSPSRSRRHGRFGAGHREEERRPRASGQRAVGGTSRLHGAASRGPSSEFGFER